MYLLSAIQRYERKTITQPLKTWQFTAEQKIIIKKLGKSKRFPHAHTRLDR